MKDKEEIKLNILKLSATTDRGQRLNNLISPVYQEKLSQKLKFKNIPQQVNKYINNVKPNKYILLWSQVV